MKPTEAQKRLLTRLGGHQVMHVYRQEVVCARNLEGLGLAVLRDDGGTELRDGERWTCSITERGREYLKAMFAEHAAKSSVIGK